MKNSSKSFILTEAILGILVVILAMVMIREKSSSDMDKVSVIVKDSDGGQWDAFKYGIKMAAEDQDMDVSVVSTGAVLSAEEETNLIQNEINNGTDALIIQPVPGKEMEEAVQKAARKVPVVLVEYEAADEEGMGRLTSVGPDDSSLGKTLAEEVMRDYGQNIRGKTLGIVSATTDAESVNSRVRGFDSIMEEAGAEVIWNVSGSFGESGKNALSGQPQVDLVIALDDGSLTMAGQCSAQGELYGAVVYGIGNSTQAIHYLDTGAVECLVVPDEFEAGYQSMVQAAQSVEHFFRKPEKLTVSHTVIRRETLFSEENQELLFTMSQ